MSFYLKEEDCGVMSAAMLGDRSKVDQELKTLYQVNGIGHIMAKNVLIKIYVFSVDSE